MSDLTIFIVSSKYRLYVDQLTTEVIRKSIHMLVALVPLLAAWNLGLTTTVLMIGIVVYTYSEFLRQQGYEVALISRLTSAAARKRDSGKFVLGPVTLGLGALLALALYPSPAAAIAIYALAFGDGLSSLAGRMFGSVIIPFTKGKSVEGSLTCFLAVLTAAYAMGFDPLKAILLAAAATVLEVLPTKDFDNILLPLGVGALALFLL